MAEICCGVVTSENEKAVSPCETSSRAARRKRMEIRRFKFVAGVAEPVEKRQKVEILVEKNGENGRLELNEGSVLNLNLSASAPRTTVEAIVFDRCPNFGMTSVIGRRRNMEDAVAVHPSFCKPDRPIPVRFHYFGVYDGHGCSHVANSCKDRLHQLVKEEVMNNEISFEWKDVMEKSFSRMDNEVIAASVKAKCRCELQTPKCDAGSTAVVAIVTPETIIVANCGDSRAVLCRGGKAIPLSIDHKPDRPDELRRIQEAGGRVIFWDGPRVLGEQGVLAMSRAIGDSYLKPFVTSEPEVTLTERSSEDECLILASDGLWDVITNETACGIARMCLNGQGPVKKPKPSSGEEEEEEEEEGGPDKACSDAAMLLTKLALARNSTDNVSVVVVDLRRYT